MPPKIPNPETIVDAFAAIPTPPSIGDVFKGAWDGWEQLTNIFPNRVLVVPVETPISVQIGESPERS